MGFNSFGNIVVLTLIWVLFWCFTAYSFYKCGYIDGYEAKKRHERIKEKLAQSDIIKQRRASYIEQDQKKKQKKGENSKWN